MSHRIYSDDFKESALRRVSEIGWRPAARELGLDHKTLFRWADSAGLDRQAITARTSETYRVATAAKNAKVAKERADARERVITKLARVSELALARELEVLAKGGFDRNDLQALTNARQKAVQGFELLEGRATTRTDIGLEGVIEGVAVAFRDAMAELPEKYRDPATALFASRLRDIEKHGLLELEAAEVIEAEAIES